MLKKILVLILAIIMLTSIGTTVMAAPSDWSYMFSNTTNFVKISQDYSATHAAIDIISNVTNPSIDGTTIKSVCAGKLGYKYNYDPDLPNTGNNSAGNYAVVVDDDGNKAGFMHMTSATSLKVGDSVSKTTTIGTVGNTGDSTGPHLHYSIFSGTSNWPNSQNSIDPKTIHTDITFK
ncbi:MAG: M23 family metallopeptidase [Oscillospiraceae bacterium]